MCAVQNTTLLCLYISIGMSIEDRYCVPVCVYSAIQNTEILLYISIRISVVCEWGCVFVCECEGWLKKS